MWRIRLKPNARWMLSIYVKNFFGEGVYINDEKLNKHLNNIKWCRHNSLYLFFNEFLEGLTTEDREIYKDACMAIYLTDTEEF